MRITETDATSGLMTVDIEADSLHAYGNGVDLNLNTDIAGIGFEDINARLDRQHKQLILKLPANDGDGFSEGEMTLFLDPLNHSIKIRAWIPGEGVWHTSVELSPEAG